MTIDELKSKYPNLSEKNAQHVSRFLAAFASAQDTMETLPTVHADYRNHMRTMANHLIDSVANAMSANLD